MKQQPNSEPKITNERLVCAMRKYGGNFVKALADCLVAGDPNNKQRIRDAFPDIIEVYTAFAKSDLTD